MIWDNFKIYVRQKEYLGLEAMLHGSRKSQFLYYTIISGHKYWGGQLIEICNLFMIRPMDNSATIQYNQIEIP